MISFVIPAHNEELWIPRAISSIRAAMPAVSGPYEIIVVDDASTDATARVAREHGAHVVQVAHRQIAAARNSGARVARGGILFFVDADTLANGDAIQAGIRAIQDGAVGGGCMFIFDCPLPLWATILHPMALAMCRPLKRVGGCFLFCTRSAFESVGGFSERHYCSEELVLIEALKRLGCFVVPRPTVITSGRKLHSIPFWRVPAILFRWRFRCDKRDALDVHYGKLSEACKGAGPAAVEKSIAQVHTGPHGGQKTRSPG